AAEKEGDGDRQSPGRRPARLLLPVPDARPGRPADPGRPVTPSRPTRPDSPVGSASWRATHRFFRSRGCRPFHNRYEIPILIWLPPIPEAVDAGRDLAVDAPVRPNSLCGCADGPERGELHVK